MYQYVSAVYVYIYVYVCICVHVCMCVWYVRTCVCMLVSVSPCTIAHNYGHMHTTIHVCTCACVCTVNWCRNHSLVGHLQEVRPMPAVTLSGHFIMCHYLSVYRRARGCRKKDRCTYAHSKLELKAWNRALKKQGERGATGGTRQPRKWCLYCMLVMEK